MTDRELLELAANAAGIGAEYDEKWGGMLITTTVIDPDDGLVFWNPLTDDGDALRLAVNLGMNIEVLTGATQINYRISGDLYHCNVGKGEGQCDGDHYMATRKAITRAAAEIGKAMP